MYIQRNTRFVVLDHMRRNNFSNKLCIYADANQIYVILLCHDKKEEVVIRIRTYESASTRTMLILAVVLSSVAVSMVSSTHQATC